MPQYFTAAVASILEREQYDHLVKHSREEMHGEYGNNLSRLMGARYF
jgi:hypothetical protein